MSETHTGGRGAGAIHCENGNVAAIGAADFLYLAAAPTFAIMALLTVVLGGSLPNGSARLPAASPLSGMVPMYLLMAAFHLVPWLRLISRRGIAARHLNSGPPPNSPPEDLRSQWTLFRTSIVLAAS